MTRPDAVPGGDRGAGTLRGRTVLVTGARGFIGAHLVARLVGLGAVVHATARSRSPGSSETGVTCWPVDLADAAATADLLAAVRPAVVFHLAGAVSGSREVDAVARTFAGNLTSTVNLLTAATAHGLPRVVLAGSMEEPHPGEVRTGASSPYAASKWAAAAYARMFHDLWSLPTVVLRIAMAYGPGQPDETKLVPYVIRCLLEGRPPELTSGSRRIDWVYVDDVVDAFLAAACVPSVDGRSLDIGSGEAVDIRATVALLQRIVGGEVPARFGAVQDRLHDTARIADLSGTGPVLGWAARVGLEDGLHRTVDWYRARRAPASRCRHGLPL